MDTIESLLKQAAQHIKRKTGEEFIATVMGATGSFGVGVLIATNKRLVYFARKIVGFEFEIMPYSNVSSIEVSEGVRGHSIQVIAPGNTFAIKWIKVGQVSEFVEHVKAMIGTNEELLLSSSDVLDQVKNLAELKEQGILTEDEFQSKKQRLLSKI